MRRVSFFTALLLLVTWIPCASASTDAIVPADAAARDYFAGDVAGAIKRLSKSLGDPQDTDALKPNLYALRTLMTFCQRANDQDCIVEWAPAAYRVLHALEFSNPLQRHSADLLAGYYFALVAEVEDTDEAARNALKTYLVEDDEAFSDQAIFIERQLLAAKFHFKLDDRVKARRAVDRALATLLSVKNPDTQRWTIATDLVDCLQLLLALGSGDRAAGLTFAMGDFVAQSLPPTSIEFIQYRLFESYIFLHRENAMVSVKAARSARGVLDQLTLTKEVRLPLDYAVNLQLAYSGILYGDSDAAEDGLRSLEQIIDLSHLRRTGTWAWQGQIAVVAMRALQNGFAGKVSNSRDMELLRTPGDFAVPSHFDESFNIWRRVGLLIAESADNLIKTRSDFRQIARDYVALVRKRARYSFDTFPTPEIEDRLIATVLLISFAKEAATASEDIDLAVSLADIATRSDRSFDSMAQIALGMTRATDDRYMLHEGLRLSSRRNKYEQQELKLLIAKASTPSTQGGDLLTDSNRRSVFADFAVALSRTQTYFAGHASYLNSDSLLPGEGEIRSVLRPDEALLSPVSVGGSLVVLVCMNASGGVVASSRFDGEAMRTDLRLLSLALTASHGPDEILDRQFPAEAAVRIYNALFKPVEGCLEGKRTVFLSGTFAVFPIPVSALLRSIPTRLDDGYALGSADWLLRHYSVGYLGMSAALVASRNRRNLSASLPFRFLGIGNPELGGVISSGETQVAAVTRGAIRNRTGEVVELPALPETRVELEAAARSLGEPTTILVGEDASEGQFRRQPLSQFRYLSFATHGLIREDIPGLREAALVLTPHEPLDPYDDGLLTASEIADLPLNADFVALSACNTANFDLNDFAADIPGMATAFAVAGVPATMATLWPVDSLTSKAVVESTFKQIGDDPDIRPANALASAQIAFIDEHIGTARAHPRYWAPFVVFGDSQSRAEKGQLHDDEVSIAETRMVTRSGGELLGATVTRSGQLVVAGIGEWNGQRFAATRASIESELSVRWKSDDYDVGGTRIAVDIGGSVLTAGYLWGGEANPVATPVLQVLNESGVKVREIKLETPGYSAFPTAAIATGDGGVLVAVSAEENSQTDYLRPRAIFLYRLSSDLKIVDQTTVSVAASSNGVVDARLARMGNGFVLSAADRLGNQSNETYFDDLLNPRLCSLKPYTWFYSVNDKPLSVHQLLSVSDVDLASLASASHGSALAIGSVRGCDGRSQLTVWRISGSSTEVLYQENGVLDTKGRGAVQMSDGRIVITGAVIRLTDVRRAHEGEKVSDYTDRLQTAVSFSQKEAADLLVVVVDETGQLEERSIIPFGSDVYGNQPIFYAGHLLVAGMVGNRAALIELSLPETPVVRH